MCVRSPPLRQATYPRLSFFLSAGWDVTPVTVAILVGNYVGNHMEDGRASLGPQMIL